MKPATYFINLFFFFTFLASIMTIVDNPAPLYMFTLVASTIGLVLMFLQHIGE